MIIRAVAAACLLSTSCAAAAQDDIDALPLDVSPVSEQRVFLPANTEVLLSTNQEVTTKGRHWNEGDTFRLTVVHDVVHEGYVVIPRGSRAVGQITWLTDKGAFGKSGKMDIELKYIEVGGRRIDVDGTYRQEGEGNTVATVGGVIVAGVFAGFITGKSAIIPQGRELMAHTANDLPLALPRNASSAQSDAMPVRSDNALGIASSRAAGADAARWRNGGEFPTECGYKKRPAPSWSRAPLFLRLGRSQIRAALNRTVLIETAKTAEIRRLAT